MHQVNRKNPAMPETGALQMKTILARIKEVEG